jgi:predicted lipoprotein
MWINTATTGKSDMRLLTWLGLIAALAVVCWRFPLFHVVSLKRATEEKAAAAFNPAAFAEQFWNEKLLPSLDSAPQAEELIPAILSDSTSAKGKFSRSVGVSESYTYFVQGKGRVVAINDDEVSLAITPNATHAEVALQAGLVFGNAVRDGTGLLNVNDYPNSQDFNAISEALNQLVEMRVQPKLREVAKAGNTIRFAGCAEVNDESTDLKPLKVVPVRVENE